MSSEIEFAEIDTAGRRVHIEYQWIARGQTAAPLMVFLHEGLGSRAMWKDFPQRLCDAAGCRGLVYSRPGYGRSTPRPSDEVWAIDFMHDQAYEVLPALLRALAIDTTTDRPWLFGHSDGGSIALIYASHFPSSVAGLIVMAPHIFVEEYGLASIRQAREAYAATELRSKLARYHADVDSAFWGWNDIWLAPAFKAWNIERELSAITCPVLAVQGLDDEYGSIEQIRGIARHVAQAQLVELPACGHSPQRDQPEMLIGAVTLFMRG